MSPDPGRPPRDATQHPAAIGPYRIVRVLGEGAMGVVYLAEQSGPLRRQVALKILKQGMDTAQVVARFESERQALAVMEHPAIARVFEAGSTDTGRPFFVMERVDGVPLTRWCDERAMRVPERVGLFVQVCSAVQHAHQKGVIHRDLKPSNVLVAAGDEGRPQVKVIDFGIARAVEPPADETRLTTLDQALGTPAYMSPEQSRASGLDIDTRTDIYSLGVLLYELLAGALPFDENAYRGWAFLAHHLEKEPPRPSVRFRGLLDTGAVASCRGTAPEALARELASDLDWIVLKALEKERDRRYHTANGLASDLERYLASEPVVARPPSRRYRTRKFVRRHRAGVAAAAGLVLLLAGFGVAMTVQAQRIARARDMADARRDQAERLIDFMLGDLRAKLEPIGRLALLDDVGDEATAYFAGLPESEFTERELLGRSLALSQIGQVRLNEGRAAEAVAALRESLRLATELVARAPDDAERLFQLSQSHFWVGYAAWRHGDLSAAESAFQAYLDVAERLVALDPHDLDYRLELGFAQSNLGSVREARGDLEGAADAFARTLEVKRDLVRRDSTRVDWLGELAESHNTLAVVRRKQGRYQDALVEHGRELELKRRVLVLEPGHAYWRYRLGMTYHFLADLQRTTGELESALGNTGAAVAVLDSLVRHDPDNAEWRRSLAMARWLEGLTLAAMDRPEQSMAALDTSRDALERMVRSDSTALDWRTALARVHTARAGVHLRFGAPAAALREAEAAGALLGTAASEAPSSVRVRVEHELVLGRALRATGRLAQAEAAFAAAVDRLDASPGSRTHPDLEPLLAEAWLLTGRGPEGRALLDGLRSRGYGDPYLMELAAATDRPAGL